MTGCAVLFHVALFASFGILKAGQLEIYPRFAFKPRLLVSYGMQYFVPNSHHSALYLFLELRCFLLVFRSLTVI